MPPGFFARLFRPQNRAKNLLFGSIFELSIDDLHFVSYPVQPSAGPRGRRSDISAFNVVFVLEKRLQGEGQCAWPGSAGGRTNAPHELPGVARGVSQGLSGRRVHGIDGIVHGMTSEGPFPGPFPGPFQV